MSWYFLRTLLCLGLFAGFVTGSFAADEPAPPKILIRRAMIDGVAWKIENSPEKPFIIASQDDLDKSFPEDKTTQAKIKENVDLSKERLVVFAWQGSGKDRLELMSPDVNNNGNIIFNYKRGLTRDLRKHINIYVLPKDRKFEVGMAK